MAQALDPGGGADLVARRVICTAKPIRTNQADLRPRCRARGPSGLFNSSLDGNARRAIDIKEGEAIDEAALKALIREAAALNLARSR